MPIHLVGLPAAGAVSSVPAPTPAPLVSALDVVWNVAPPMVVIVVVAVIAPVTDIPVAVTCRVFVGASRAILNGIFVAESV